MFHAKLYAWYLKFLEVLKQAHIHSCQKSKHSVKNQDARVSQTCPHQIIQLLKTLDKLEKHTGLSQIYIGIGI